MMRRKSSLSRRSMNHLNIRRRGKRTRKIRRRGKRTKKIRRGKRTRKIRGGGNKITGILPGKPRHLDKGEKDTEEVVVLSFNILSGGGGYGPYSRIAEIISNSAANMVMLQEPYILGQIDKPDHGHIESIVEDLGREWKFWVGNPQGSDNTTAFLSPWSFNVIESTGTLVVTTPSGNEMAVHNVHLSAKPYGPYTAARMLKSGKRPEAVVAEVTREAVKTRKDEVKGFMSAVETQTGQGRHCLLAGDFNEPSHLSRSIMDIRWPCSKAAEEAGLIDCYSTHCQRTGSPMLDSWTWSWIKYLAQASSSERKFIKSHGEISDRIDYIYLASPSPKTNPRSLVTLKSCVLVGDNLECAEVEDSPWPSDHAAVLATFVISPADEDDV